MNAVPQPPNYGIRPLLGLDGRALTVPETFAAWLGYAGDRRWVAFCWGAGDTVEYDDGVVGGRGHYGPWLLWSRHLAVAPALVGVDYGSSDSPPVHRVLLDRFSHRLHAGGTANVAQFLADAPDLRAEREAWEALSEEERDAARREAGEAFRRIVEELQDLNSWEEASGPGAPLSTDGLRERAVAAAAFDRAAVPRLREWLAARPVPCPGCRTAHVAGDFNPTGLGVAARLGVAACPSCGEAFYSQALVERVAELRAESLRAVYRHIDAGHDDSAERA